MSQIKNYLAEVEEEVRKVIPEAHSFVFTKVNKEQFTFTIGKVTHQKLEEVTPEQKMFVKSIFKEGRSVHFLTAAKGTFGGSVRVVVVNL